MKYSTNVTFDDEADEMEETRKTAAMVETQEIDEMVETTSDVDDEMASVPSRKKKTSDPIYKNPTRDELSELNETTTKFKSNLFKLQLEQLYSEITITEKAKTKLETALRTIKGILDNIKEKPDTPLPEFIAQYEKIGVIVPFPEPKPESDTKLHFNFIPPTAVYIIGSFLLKTIIKTPNGITVDLAFEIPKDVFVEKDHMNYRYFYKRSCYLAVLAAEIKQNFLDCISIEFESLNGDQRKPIINVTISKGLFIRIIPMISQSQFNQTKLAPTKNSCRPTVFSTYPQDQTVIESTIPTPRYNASILTDSAFLYHLNYLNQSVANCVSFKEAVCISKVWLAQRGFGREKSSFGGFHFAMLMAYLLNGKNTGNFKASNAFSTYQLFKITIDFIASMDTSKCVFMTETGFPFNGDDFSSEAFSSVSDVVIVDPSGKLNIAAAISIEEFQLVQMEARNTLNHLNNSKKDHFKEIFLENLDNDLLRFDHCFRVSNPDAKPTLRDIIDFTSPSDVLKYKLPKILKRGLTDRVSLVACSLDKNVKWPVNHLHSLPTMLTVFVNACHGTSLKVVEMGPSPEDITASNQFKCTWGSKSETRRFKDGAIRNSVVYESGPSFEERALILPKMVEYLLTRHSGSESVVGSAQFLKNLNTLLVHPETGSLRGFKSSMDTFQILVRILQDIELPLNIVNVLPCSDATRYTSVFGPEPDMDTFKPMQVIIEFENSGRWPDNYEAIQEMKLAFYVRTCQLLSASYPEIQSCIGEECLKNSCGKYFMEIRMNGFLYKCVIRYVREAKLLETLHGKESKVCLQYRIANVVTPTLSNKISSICVEHPFLATTIRLLKRWLSCHMLSTQIPGLAIELIAIHALLSGPWIEPNCVLTGFCRVLHFISKWDWKHDPLIVTFDDESTETHQAIMDNFIRIRHQSGKVIKKAMFIGTAVDPTCALWDCTGVIASRIVMLATSAIQNIKEPEIIHNIFVTPTTHYDVLFILNPTYTPKPLFKTRQKKKVFKNLETSNTGFNPYIVECYLEELIRAFGHVALFFFDEYSGDKIGMLWFPCVGDQHKFKTSCSFSTLPVESSEKMIIANKKAMIEEMRHLGEGLVMQVIHKI